MQNYQNNNSRRNTGSLGLAVFLLILTIAFSIGSFVVFNKKGSYNSKDLDNFVAEQYNEIYHDNYTKEKNALVVLVIYPDGKKYDIRCKNSGNLDIFASYDFGEKYPTISSDLKESIPEISGYQIDLMKYLADAINSNNTSYSKFYSSQYGNSNTSKIINKTEIQFTGETDLRKAINVYHQLTNTNVSIVIEENTDIYGRNYFLFTVLLIATISCAIGSIIAFKILSSETTLVEYQENKSTNKPTEQIDLDSDKDPFDEYYKNHQYK